MDALFKKENFKSKRLARVAGQIQQEIAALLIRGLKDPRLAVVNITEVKVSIDLRYAKVFYNILGGQAARRQEIQDGLDHAAGFIRREIGKNLTMKFLPELSFEYDDTLDKAERIERILQQAKNNGAGGEG